MTSRVRRVGTIPAGWPTYATTGPRTEPSTIVDGGYQADVPGAVLTGLDVVNGDVNITAPNVTFRDCRFTYYGNWVVVVRPDTGTTTFEFCEVLGQPGQIAESGMRVTGAGLTVVRGCRFSDCMDGYSPAGNGLVEDCFIQVPSNTDPGFHNDCLQISSCNGLVIRHNTFRNPNVQTSCIALFEETGSVVDCLVEGNYLDGGGYTMYAGNGSNPPSDVRVQNNLWGQSFYPRGGFNGSGTAWAAGAPGAVWSGNTYWVSGDTVSAPSA